MKKLIVLILTVLFMVGCDDIFSGDETIYGLNNDEILGAWQDTFNEDPGYLVFYEDGIGERYTYDVFDFVWEISSTGVFSMSGESGDLVERKISISGNTMTLSGQNYIKYDGQLPDFSGFDNSLIAGIYQNTNEETSFIELLVDGTGNRYNVDEIRTITWEVNSDGTEFTMAYEGSEGNTYNFSYTDTTITIATSTFNRFTGDIPVYNSNQLTTENYYNFNEGTGIKYNVTDEYGSLDCDIWVTSQSVPDHLSDYYDYIVTLTKSGIEGGYFSNSTIGAQNQNSGDYNILNFYHGMGLGNQANFYQGIHQIADNITTGDSYSQGDDRSYVIETSESITINNETFNDCIKVSYTNTGDNTYLQGEGYGIFAKDIGLIYLEFIRAESNDPWSASRVIYTYIERNEFNPVSIHGKVTSNGVDGVSDIYIQIASRILDNSAITDENGGFVINTLYGYDHLLYIGYDGNDEYEGILDFGYPDESYIKEIVLNNTLENRYDLYINLNDGSIKELDLSIQGTWYNNTLDNYAFYIDGTGYMFNDATEYAFSWTTTNGFVTVDFDDYEDIIIEYEPGMGELTLDGDLYTAGTTYITNNTNE